MDKSPDAFRTISEVAEDLDLPQHVLRFWETRFAQIKPLKRGGGRRYYRPDDVDLLRGIRRLLYGQGYTIKGVQRILKQQGPRAVQAIGRGESLPAAPSPAEREADFDEAAAAAGDHAYGTEEGEEAPDLPRGGREPGGQENFAPGGVPGLSDGARERLEAALAELLECRRVLSGL